MQEQDVEALVLQAFKAKESEQAAIPIIVFALSQLQLIAQSAQSSARSMEQVVTLLRQELDAEKSNSLAPTSSN